MATVTQEKRAIEWMDWGAQAFERARREDKLVLLDSGATWCHWCHVMDHVTYEDPEVCDLVRSRFVPVRIDRDRRGELDAYLQRSVPIIRSHAGGWPLTVILTPQGHVLYKAAFLPPRADPHYGAETGLIDVLVSLEGYWRQNREQVASAGQDIHQALRQYLVEAYSHPAAATPGLVQTILGGIRDEYDPTHGGFGLAPKFFNPAAIELLLSRAWEGDAQARQMAVTTLESIARGGVRDHLGGGFHRYSVDERWRVPHFEKMAYDNAALLALYANAWALTAGEEFQTVARETLAWIDQTLLDPGRAGFYASQDADVIPGDDGDYFTWTVGEVQAALAGQDVQPMLAWYDVDEVGNMHGRPGRNVLHTPKTLAQQASLTQQDAGELGQRIQAGRRRLQAVRAQRPAPSVDKTIFADQNGMLIDAYLTAWERLGDDKARDTALAVLDRLLSDLRDDRGVFAHYRQAGQLREVGTLADQAWMLRALLHACAVAALPAYLDAAKQVADFVLAELIEQDGGLLNRPTPPDEGPLTVPPVRTWEDSPVRSSASVAAQTLIDLAHLAGQTRYGEAGRRALASLAGAVQRGWGTFLAGYAMAVDQMTRGPRTVVVVGPVGDATVRDLAHLARRTYIPSGYVLEIDPASKEQLRLLARMGYRSDNRPLAYVCRADACLAPARTPEELRQRLEELARGAG